MSDDGCAGTGCGCLVMIAIVVAAWWLLPVGEWWNKVETLWHEEWSGYAYPDRHNLRDSVFVGTFDESSDCLRAARLRAGPNGAYECGLNCKMEDGLNICVETIGD